MKGRYSHTHRSTNQVRGRHNPEYTRREPTEKAGIFHLAEPWEASRAEKAGMASRSGLPFNCSGDCPWSSLLSQQENNKKIKNPDRQSDTVDLKNNQAIIHHFPHVPDTAFGTRDIAVNASISTLIECIFCGHQRGKGWWRDELGDWNWCVLCIYIHTMYKTVN